MEYVSYSTFVGQKYFGDKNVATQHQKKVILKKHLLEAEVVELWKCLCLFDNKSKFVSIYYILVFSIIPWISGSSNFKLPAGQRNLAYKVNSPALF